MFSPLVDLSNIFDRYSNKNYFYFKHNALPLKKERFTSTEKAKRF